jgi:uncharacterized protein
VIYACALIAFSCEALAGFGGTVLALALGAQLMPLPELMAIFIPANLALSAAMMVRHFVAVDWRLLLRRIGPAMLIGLPVGMLVHRWAGRALAPAFASVVVGLALLEALRLLGGEQQKLGKVGTGLLWAAGVVHGAYGTGGPLVVFVMGREVSDKQSFRATLAVLWLALNALLVASLAADGRVTVTTLGRSLLLLPIVAGAWVAGEWCAQRISDRPFRALGAALLGAAGILLLVRGN